MSRALLPFLGRGHLPGPASRGSFAAALSLLALVAALGLSRLSADTLSGFEVDADHATSGEGLFAQSNDDWAESVASSGEGVFLAGTGGSPDFLGCYDSNISVNPSVNGAVTFMCDGSSDSRFDGNGGDAVTEPEQNIVGPGGKQTNDGWPINAGSVTGKDDFSHAYSLFRMADSSCDADTLPDDPFFMLAGHRGDNEGDAFWGFELDQIAPAGFSSLTSNGGTTFNLDFNRSAGDILVSVTLSGGGTNPLLEVFNWNTTTFAPAASSCPANPARPQGDSLLRTNPANDVQAPPWNVPVCDPTGTNGANTCRLVNQNGVAPAQAGDNLIPPRDFIEAVIDFSAFGLADFCFNSLIFTSRSAHPLETADLKDIGGVDVQTCFPPATPTPTPAPPPPQQAAPPTPTPAPPPGVPGLPPLRFPPTGGAPGATFALTPVLLVASLVLVGAAVMRAWKPRRDP